MNGIKKLPIISHELLPPAQDSSLSSFRIPEVPKSIEFKNTCFSPNKVSPAKNEKERKSTEINKSSILTTANTNDHHQPAKLTEIMEDNEDDGFPGLNQNVNSDIMHKSFFNKSIMDFNRSKNYNKTVLYTEPVTYSLNDARGGSPYRVNSENFYNIEEKYSVFDRPDFQKSYPTIEKIEKKNLEKKGFHPTFKLDFNNKLPPTDEKVGLSSRLYMNLEEDVKLLKKMREEMNSKRKKNKKKIENVIKETNQDLEIFQLHENFEKNLELFKREEEEFLRKIKKINLLDDESSNENAAREKSKLEKDLEESLMQIVIMEEKAVSREYDSKKTLKEATANKVFDSKLSKMTVDSKISSNKNLKMN